MVYYSTLMSVAYGKSGKEAVLDSQIIRAKQLEDIAGNNFSSARTDDAVQSPSPERLFMHAGDRLTQESVFIATIESGHAPIADQARQGGWSCRWAWILDNGKISDLNPANL